MKERLVVMLENSIKVEKEKAVLVRDTLDNIHIITKHAILEAFTK